LLQRSIEILFEQNFDIEPLSPAEKRKPAQSKAEFAQGDYLTLEEYERERGL